MEKVAYHVFINLLYNSISFLEDIFFTDTSDKDIGVISVQDKFNIVVSYTIYDIIYV